MLSLNSPGRRLRQMEQAELLTISYKNEILLLFSYITNSNATVHFFPFFNNENTCHHVMANVQDVNPRISLRWPNHLISPVNKAISLPSEIFWFFTVLSDFPYNLVISHLFSKLPQKEFAEETVHDSTNV